VKAAEVNTIRVMLIDDEENALNIMELFLTDFKEISIVGKYLNPLKALEVISR
jgi:two-component system LytT family response regulator